MRADARDFWPLRGLNALFGRRIATVPIAFNSGKCTTRICGQTAIISVLLISRILGQSRLCTAPCRGQCGHRPLQTYPKSCSGRQSRLPLRRITNRVGSVGRPTECGTKNRSLPLAGSCYIQAIVLLPYTGMSRCPYRGRLRSAWSDTGLRPWYSTSRS